MYHFELTMFFGLFIFLQLFTRDQGKLSRTKMIRTLTYSISWHLLFWINYWIVLTMTLYIKNKHENAKKRRMIWKIK